MVIDWDYESDKVNMKTRRMWCFWAKQATRKAFLYRTFSATQRDDTKVHGKRIWESFLYFVRILSYFTMKSIYKEKTLSISAVSEALIFLELRAWKSPEHFFLIPRHSHVWERYRSGEQRQLVAHGDYCSCAGCLKNSSDTSWIFGIFRVF